MKLYSLTAAALFAATFALAPATAAASGCNGGTPDCTDPSLVEEQCTGDDPNCTDPTPVSGGCNGGNPDCTDPS
jgi:hypothetical protein